MALIKIMAKEYKVSINWLLLEQGPMFIEVDEKGGETHVLLAKTVSQEIIPISQEDMLKMIRDLQDTVRNITKKQ